MSDESTILIVDDSPDLVKILKFQLSKLGYRILSAGNGKEALAVLNKEKPDLIILDMNMPEMGGIDFYNEICGTGDSPRYPVFVLTARANLEQLFKDLKVEGFMSKPFDMDKLIAEVKIILQKHKGVEWHAGKVESAKPASVMIVEDDQEMFNRITLAFLNKGYIVNGVKSGSEALEKIKNVSPDVVLIKLKLPQLSGDQVIARLQTLPELEDILLLLYNTHATSVEDAILDRLQDQFGNAFINASEPSALVDFVDSSTGYLR